MTAHRIGFLIWPSTKALTLALAEEALRVAQRVQPEVVYELSFLLAEPATDGAWQLPGEPWAGKLEGFQKLFLLADEPPELRAALRQAVQSVAEARQSRLVVAAGHIPSIIWHALVICAGVVLVFAALVHGRQPRSARWIGTLLAMMIAVQVHAVYVIDRPFVGVVAVSDAPLREALQQLQRAAARP